MSGFYQSSIQSYSSVYSQDSNGRVKQTTQKYFANGHNGHGEIYQEQVFPDKGDMNTRDLNDIEINTLFNRYPNKMSQKKIKEASIKSEVAKKFTKYQKDNSHVNNGGSLINNNYQDFLSFTKRLSFINDPFIHDPVLKTLGNVSLEE